MKSFCGANKFSLPVFFGFFLFFSFAILPLKTFAATQFVSTIMQSGGDFSSLNAWNTSITGTSSPSGGGIDVTATTTKVFSISGITGSIPDGTSITGGTSGATGVAVHITATQILIKSISGTFSSGEQVRKDVSNYVTISNSGDSAILIAKIDGTWTVADTAMNQANDATILQGFVGSATNYAKIYTTAAARHNGIYSTSSYRLAPVGGYKRFQINGSYVYFDGIQINTTPSNLSVLSLGRSVHTTNIYISNCIIVNSDGGGLGGIGITDSTNVYLWNNIFINSNHGPGTGISAAWGNTIYIYNNTVYGFGTGIDTGYVSSANAHVINNISIGNTTDYTNHTGNYYANNISGDNTSPNSSYQNKTISFVSTSTLNFLLAPTDTSAIDQGVNLSADPNLPFNTDIIGTSRPQGSVWDIGADEYFVVPPVLSGGSPTGTLPSGTTSATLSVATNEIATCKYATTSGVAYASMANTFTNTGGTLSTTTVSGLTNGNNYNYYVRCMDASNNPDISDYTITFSVSNPDLTPPTPGTISFTNVTATTITATTTGASDNVALAAQPFRYHNVTTGAYSSATSTAITFTGLTPNTSYTFEVGVQDLAGNWATSTQVATTTLILTHTITASVGANGTISPTGTVTVNDGASQTFTITPNGGYAVATLTVDGSTVTASTSYIFTNVTTNRTIAATFSVAPITPAEFITTVNTDGGGDYTSLQAWQTAMHSNLTVATTLVFSGTRNNTVTDGTILYLWRSGVYKNVSATTTHITATQAMFTSASSTFGYASGDVWCDSLSACNTTYFTISNSGNTVIARVNASGTATDTTAVNITGWSTNATNYVKIVGDNNTGKASTIHYRLGGMTLGSDGIVLRVGAIYTQIYNIEITNYMSSSGNVYGIGLNDTSQHSMIDGCIIHDNASTSNNPRGIYIGDSDGNDRPDNFSIIRNCIIYNLKSLNGNSYGIAFVYNYGNYIYNNTVYNITGPGASSGYGFYSQGANGTSSVIFPLLKNNISYNNKTADYTGTFSASSTNNLSKDGTVPPYNTYYVNKTLSFANTTAGSEDLHLAPTDTDAIDKGADLSAIFTDDIDGSTRPIGPAWDIGADEYSDITPPQLTVTVPANNSSVWGSGVTLTATSTDNIGVTGVQFVLDGITNIGSSGATSPYSITWDSTTVGDGAHTISAVAHDASNNFATSTAVNIIVSNHRPALLNISSGTPASTTATITWTTNVGATSQVEYGLSAVYTASTTPDSNLVTSHSVNLSALTSGTIYHFRIISADVNHATSTSGDQTFNTLDITPPQVTITAPASSTQVSGNSVILTATSTDNVGVASVQFILDGITNIGSSGATSPYSINWNSTSTTDGAHTISAVARDAAGNQATSTISITVKNFATEFVSTIMQSGGEYVGVKPWYAAMVANGGIDLTSTTTKVFSISGITGLIPDGTSVTGGTSGATGIAVHVTATQILIKNISGIFSSGEQVRKDGSNYVTISNVGDSARLTAKIDGTWTSPETTASGDGNITLQNATTSATNFIRIYTTTTARHNGKWKSTAYTFAPTGYGHLYVNENYVTIDGLQILSPNGNSNTIIHTAPTSASSIITFSNNIFYGGGQGLGIMQISGSGVTDIWNNLFYDTNKAGTAIDLHYNLVSYVYNNTIYGFGTGIDAEAYSSGQHAKNNLSYGNNVDYHGSFASDSTNNISKDNTSPNTLLRNKTVSFVDVYNNNFLLSNVDTSAVDQGVSLSTDPNLSFTTDIIGTTRPQGNAWDIGDNEFTTSNSQAPVTYTITATSTANGIISPSGALSVGSGDSQTYTITPSTGYFIDSLVVDGTTVLGQGSYTFSKITTNHTINAIFSPNSEAGTSVTRPLLFHRINYASSTPLQSLYVSPTGSDSNNCSLASPCRQISHAVTLVSPGTTIYVADGTYDHFAMTNIQGTADNPIIIYAQGDNAIISPANTDTDGVRGNIYVHFSSYIVIDGLKTYNGTGQLGDGLAVRTSPHVTVRNVVSGNNNAWALTSGYSDYITFENNEGYGSVVQHAMYIQNTTHHAIIRGNLLHDDKGDGLHMNGDQNTDPETTGGGPYYTGALTYTITDAIVEDNIFWNNPNSSGMDMDGGQDSIIRNNIAFNNMKGITLFQEDAAEAPQNDKVYNNTVIDSSYAAMRLTTAQGPIYVYNNIMINDRGTCSDMIANDDGGQYIFSDNNVWVGSGTCSSDFANWKSSTGSDSHSTLLAASTSLNFLDPTNGNFHLTSGSPAIDFGTSTFVAYAEITGTSSLANDVSNDRDNVSRPQGSGFDVGAYEYNASASTTTYTITASAGSNGVLSPSGAVSVNASSSRTFTIIPNTGYSIATLTVDGSQISTSTSYTFSNVQTNHTIAATFTDITAPSVPTALNATAISSSQISLSWTASTDGAGVAGYNIYRGGIFATTTTGTTYSDTGLTANTTYSYAVSAYDAVGNTSSKSGSATATTNSYIGHVYYMATTGNDTTGNGTIQKPWLTLQHSFLGMNGGDTLIIEDGTYTGSANQIKIHQTPPVGTSANWTTIEAQHDGAAIFDGQKTLGMFGLDYAGTLTNMYMQFEGIFWKNDASGVDVSYGKYFKFLRCGISDESEGNTASFAAGYSSDGLFENCYVFGSGRYNFLVFNSSEMIIRNCVARTDRVNAGNDPIGGYAIYGGVNVEIQNSIQVDSDQDSRYVGSGEFMGSFGNPTSGAALLDNTNVNFTNDVTLNSHLGGASIGSNHSATYNNDSWWNISVAPAPGNNLFNLRGNDGGSNFGHFNNITVGNASSYNRGISGYDINNLNITNSILFGFASSGAALYTRGPNSSESYNSLYNNVLNYDGYTGNVHDLTTTNPIWNASTNSTGALKYITEVESNSNLSGKGQTGADIGANIKTLLGTPGTLWGETGYNTDTGVSMWPFPNESLIKTKMAAYSYTDGNGTINGARGFAASSTGLYGGPITLTSYIWEALGNPCPSNICNYASTTPTYSISGTISGLSGTVVLQNNGGNDISTTSNGSFTFSTQLNSGATYSITILSQPSGQTCSLTNNSGTVSANITNVSVSCTTNSVSVSSGGGGGGGGYYYIPPTVATTTKKIATTTKQITTTTTTTTQTPVSKTATSTAGSINSFVFTRNLSLGSSGTDVTALQQILSSTPGIYPSGIISGYFGNLTLQAVENFQLQYGIVSSPTDAGYGMVGPKTRAKLSGTSINIPKPVATTTTTIIPVQTPTSLTKTLVKGMSDPQVSLLQQKLAKLPDIYPSGIVSGYFGNLTLQAVEAFQLQYGIISSPMDFGYGVVGPGTEKELNKMQ